MLFATPYNTPTYFIWLIIGLIPIIISLIKGRRFRIYETALSLFFLFVTFGGHNWKQGLALIAFIIFQTILTTLYNIYRKRYDQYFVYVSVLILSLAPLLLIKLTPFLEAKSSILGFLGVSYLTFKGIQTIIEIRDGVLKDFKPYFFIQFLAFFPTISSGPIDRYRRFRKDYLSIPSLDKYMEMLDKAVHYLFVGLLYNFILSYFFGEYLLPQLTPYLNIHNPYGIWALIAYMYVYSMYLFFNFAGYSLFAVSISYFMGIETPMNFDKPFKSKNIKEFWNRWHISLSFWFRDYVFMRLVFFLMKHKVFKSRKTTANIAYIVNMLTMGLWHGETWFYVEYGLIHGVALVVNDWWSGFKKKHSDVIPSNKYTELLSIFITFNFVCFTFLIFSGELNKFLFHH